MAGWKMTKSLQQQYRFSVCQWIQKYYKNNKGQIKQHYPKDTFNLLHMSDSGVKLLFPDKNIHLLFFTIASKYSWVIM